MMKGRGKAAVSLALSCALAFSPLAPVGTAVAQEQGELESIELAGNDTDATVEQGSDQAESQGDQVVLGDDSAAGEQKEEGQQEKRVVELGNEGEEAAKALDASAEQTRVLLEGQSDSNKDGGAIDFVEANGTARHSEGSADVTAETRVMEATEHMVEDDRTREVKVVKSSDPFVVRNDVTCSERITVKGDVILVICNGKTLTCKKGIEVAEGGHLMVYRQDGDNPGKLVCQTNGSKVAAISVNEGSKLTINGCTVDATCKTYDGAGIGGDKDKNAGEITINAGEVTATSKKNGAGIGGGLNGSGGTITINGGKVTAKAGDEDGAGIGGGDCGSSGTIAINGGEVTASGASHGAGIGGGDASSYGDGDSITITGGTVDAKGGEYAAGIGAGGDSSYGTITIAGGTITAKGGTESAGIGSANKGGVDKVEITGGDVIATGDKRGAGIGGGDGNDTNGGQYGTISISGQGTKVRAFGGDEAAGIGTGNEPKKNEGTISISDGALVKAVGGCKSVKVNDDRSVTYDGSDDTEPELTGQGASGDDEADFTASKAGIGGGKYGAGIGGGDLATGGTINISGQGTVVYAYGSKRAAGVGAGDKAGGNASGKITIDDHAKVTAIGGECAAGIGAGNDGSFDEITIKGDGCNVEARGGKCGAGIGGGDCSDHGRYGTWQEGSINISGPDSNIVAVGGADAAGIGGGNDGSGLNINIENVGPYAGGKGSVVAVGMMGGSGVGGGCAALTYTNHDDRDNHMLRSFKEINITNAKVTALGVFGAGVGTGGHLAKDAPRFYNVGGTINITNSFVSGISGAGGAGIGGGSWGYAQHINISGGTIAANGGAVQTNLKASKSIPGVSFLQCLAEERGVSGMDGIPADVIAAMKETGSDVSSFKITMGKVAKELGFVSFDTFAFQGAGIGGGFHAPGGEINIKDNADITAAAGVIPKGKGYAKSRAASIGAGAHYDYAYLYDWFAFGELSDPKEPYYELDPSYGKWSVVNKESAPEYHEDLDLLTKVNIYDEARVAFSNLKAVEKGKDENGETKYGIEMVDADMKRSDDPTHTQNPTTTTLVKTHQFAHIDQITETFKIAFNKNADDATGEMGQHPATQQTLDPMVWQNPTKQVLVPVPLPPCGYQRKGYAFAGWNERPDGSGKTYYPADQEVYGALQTMAAQQQNPDPEAAAAALKVLMAKCPMLGNDTELYAQWVEAPEEEPVIKTITFVKNAPDGSDEESHTQSFTAGEKTSLEPNEFECANHAFTGWNTQADGKGTAYADKADVTSDGDLTLYAQWQDGKWAKFGYTLALEDGIDMTYNVKDLTDDPKNYTIEYGYTDEEPKVETLKNKKLNKIALASGAATQMSDTVDVVVRHKDADGKETIIKKAQYSVKGYCKSLIAQRGNSKNDADKKLVELCKATLDYGARVQEQRKYHTDNLANDGVYFFDNAAIDIPVTPGRKAGSCDGIYPDLLTINLTATSKTQFVVLLPHAAGANKADYEFTLDGRPYSVDDVIDRNGKFEVWIKGIGATGLGGEHIVTISKDGKTFGYAASPVTLMSNAVNCDEPISPELFRTFYNYYQKANAYAETKLTPKK